MVPVLKGLWADLERMKVRLWVADRGDLRVVMLGHSEWDAVNSDRKAPGGPLFCNFRVI